jgi:hypothetical protein
MAGKTVLLMTSVLFTLMTARPARAGNPAKIRYAKIDVTRIARVQANRRFTPQGGANRELINVGAFTQSAAVEFDGRAARTRIAYETCLGAGSGVAVEDAVDLQPDQPTERTLPGSNWVDPVTMEAFYASNLRRFRLSLKGAQLTGGNLDLAIVGEGGDSEWEPLLIGRSRGFANPAEAKQGLEWYRNLGLIDRTEIVRLNIGRGREFPARDFMELAGWTAPSAPSEKLSGWSAGTASFAYTRAVSVLALPIHRIRDQYGERVLGEEELQIRLSYEEK